MLLLFCVVSINTGMNRNYDQGLLRSANKSSQDFWNQALLWYLNKIINPWGSLIVNAVAFIFLITVKQISFFFFSLDPYQILGPTSSRLANPGELTLACKVFFPECSIALWDHRDLCPKFRPWLGEKHGLLSLKHSTCLFSIRMRGQGLLFSVNNVHSLRNFWGWHRETCQ